MEEGIQYEMMCLMFQGRITVTGLLDREKGDMYTLTVVADDGGPKKDSTVVCCFIVNFVIKALPLFSCAILNALQYTVCCICSVIENLMAFLFYSLHLSLGLQKVRLYVLFIGLRI